MVPDEVEALIEDHLMRYYLRRERSSLARVVSEIRCACGERGFQLPTRRTVQRRLDAMDAREVSKAREGTKAARQRFAPVTGKNRGECLKLCVSDRVHAVFRYVQASKRPVNIMAS